MKFYGNNQDKVAKVMIPNPWSVSPDDTIERIDDMFRARNFASAPVIQNNEFIGLITAQDIRGMSYAAKQNTLVRDRMNTAPSIITENTTIAEAQQIMNTRRFRSLPVLEGRQLRGMVFNVDIKHIGPPPPEEETKTEWTTSTPPPPPTGGEDSRTKFIQPSSPNKKPVPLKTIIFIIVGIIICILAYSIFSNVRIAPLSKDTMATIIIGAIICGAIALIIWAVIGNNKNR